MDLKALMQKLEIIDKKQNLMEAEKKETTWTDKSGKKHPATQVKGDKYTGKEAEKDSKSKKTDEAIIYRSAIAQELLREFNLEEAPAQNPWANDPAKSAAWAALTPQDQQWLGGADPTDPYILARAPNKGKPAAPAAAPAADPTDPSSAAAVNGMDKASDDAAAAAAATKPAATAQPPAGGAGGDAAVEATRKRMKELLDKLSKTGGVSGAAAAPAAAPAAKPPVGGKPAAGAKMPAVDQMGNPTPGA